MAFEFGVRSARTTWAYSQVKQGNRERYDGVDWYRCLACSVCRAWAADGPDGASPRAQQKLSPAQDRTGGYCSSLRTVCRCASLHQGLLCASCRVIGTRMQRLTMLPTKAQRGAGRSDRPRCKPRRFCVGGVRGAASRCIEESTRRGHAALATSGKQQPLAWRDPSGLNCFLQGTSKGSEMLKRLVRSDGRSCAFGQWTGARGSASVTSSS